jgi:hypothetical protein
MVLHPFNIHFHDTFGASCILAMGAGDCATTDFRFLKLGKVKDANSFSYRIRSLFYCSKAPFHVLLVMLMIKRQLALLVPHTGMHRNVTPSHGPVSLLQLLMTCAVNGVRFEGDGAEIPVVPLCDIEFLREYVSCHRRVRVQLRLEQKSGVDSDVNGGQTHETRFSGRGVGIQQDSNGRSTWWKSQESRTRRRRERVCDLFSPSVFDKFWGRSFLSSPLGKQSRQVAV